MSATRQELKIVRVAESVSPQVEVQSNIRPQAGYSAVWVFRVRRGWLRSNEQQRSLGRTDFEQAVLSAAPSVELRAAYSLKGLRPDADFILWLLTDDLDRLQDLSLTLQSTYLGLHTVLHQVYLGVGGPSRYVDDHVPAFIQGQKPRAYAAFYPFAKTPEWYLLPYEQRRQLMVEHGQLGKPFDIATNTVNAFGLGDDEFIVTLEADDPSEIVRCIEGLRLAEVRKYTARDTPIYLGRRKGLAQVLSDLG